MTENSAVGIELRSVSLALRRAPLLGGGTASAGLRILRDVSGVVEPGSLHLVLGGAFLRFKSFAAPAEHLLRLRLWENQPAEPAGGETGSRGLFREW